MYTDIHYESSKVKAPGAMVRDIASKDCIRLAGNCLAHAKKHVTEKPPEPRTRAQDQLFAMKLQHLQKIANTEDFWWFYIAQLEAGKQDFAEAVVEYQKEYMTKGKQFKT